MSESIFSGESGLIISFIYDKYETTKHVWDKRNELAWYLSKCCMKGVLNAENKRDLERFSDRWINGKRAYTAPGTKKAKRLMRQLRKQTPAYLIDAWSTLDVKLIEQAKDSDKVANFLAGQIMKLTKEHKPMPALVKEFVKSKLGKPAHSGS